MRAAMPVRALRRLATVLVAGFLAVSGPVTMNAVAGSAPGGHAKVVIIVGPVGSLTGYYRGLADAAVAAARRVTDQVVTLYSPDATWPAARRALQGASVVVYLGHGNGWPSPYRDALFPPTQDGLGLNPVAGADDRAHQYFGEAFLAKHVRLAPGAVVVLSHLCYASGAAEPGMANPSLDVAVQRVDNYAAGWLAAGAASVVAEGHLGPAYYVTALLGDHSTPEAAWRRSPTFHGHLVASDSVRNPGSTVLLDPDTAGSGYYRSIVQQPGGAGAPGQPSQVRAGSVTASTAGATVAAAASLLVPGSAAADIAVAGPTVADSAVGLNITFDKRTAAGLPKRLLIGETWTRLGSDGAVSITAPASAAGTDASPAPASAPPAASTAGAPPATDPPSVSADPAATDPPVATDPPAATDPSAAIDIPAEVDQVAPEADDSLLVTQAAAGSGRHRTATIHVPSTPGLYRLVLTLHDSDGIEYDAGTQELLRPQIVHVTGQTWVSFVAPDQLVGIAGQPLFFALRVANTGSRPWGPVPADPTQPASQAAPDAQPTTHRPPDDRGAAASPSDPVLRPTPLVIARWLALDPPVLAAPGLSAPGLGTPGGGAPGDGSAAGGTSAGGSPGDAPQGDGTAAGGTSGGALQGDPPPVSAPIPLVPPGSSAVLVETMPAPPTPGGYLLIVDLVTADGVSLAASGVPPAMIRVFVLDAPAQAPTAPDASTPGPL